MTESKDAPPADGSADPGLWIVWLQGPDGTWHQAGAAPGSMPRSEVQSGLSKELAPGTQYRLNRISGRVEA